MDVTRVTTQSMGWDIGDKQVYPAGSETFYRLSSLDDIKARVKGNAVEQETYVNAANHEMDEIQARFTAYGNVLSKVDHARLRELRAQFQAVSDDNPDAPEFQNKLAIALDRANKVDPVIAWTDKHNGQLKEELKADPSKKFEYLSALDERRQELFVEMSEKARLGTLTSDDLSEHGRIAQEAEWLRENPPFGGPEGEELNGWLKHRVDQYVADIEYFRTQIR